MSTYRNPSVRVPRQGVIAGLSGRMPLVSEKYGPVVSWKYLPLGKITGRARDIINEELFAEYTKPDTPEKFKREIEAELVSLNGTLVDQIANKYSRGLSWIKMERDDLVSEGGDGLLTAIRKFEPWIEVPFAKFAPWWIRQRISRAIKDQRELIHCPEEVQLKVHKMKKIEDGMTEELTEPTTEAIARKMGIEEKKVVCLRAAKKMMRTDSLDVPIGDESEGATISALIPTQEKNPEEMATNIGLHELVADLIKEFATNPRDEKILLASYAGQGLGEISRQIGITGEAVRQTICKALARELGSALKEAGMSAPWVLFGIKEKSVERARKTFAKPLIRNAGKLEIMGKEEGITIRHVYRPGKLQ